MESQMKLTPREKTSMIMEQLRGNWGFFAGALVLAWMNTACNAVIPQIIGVTLDSVLGDKEPGLPGFVQALLPLDRLRADPWAALWAAAGAWRWPPPSGACASLGCGSTWPGAPRAL